MSAHAAEGIKTTNALLSSGTGWGALEQFQYPVVLARDLRTVEIRQFYPLPSSREQTSCFLQEAYFFFPTSFGITPDSWRRDTFYQHARVYARLHAPSLALADLCDVDHPLNPAGLLSQRIRRMLKDTMISSDSMTALAQMFGAEVTDAILREANILRRLARSAKEPRDINSLYHLLETFCGNCIEALRTLRRVTAKAEVFRGIAPTRLLSSLAFAEEYGCAVLDEHLSEIATHIEGNRALRDGSAISVRMRLVIARTLERLNMWRRGQGFALPDSRDFEYYAYRINLLKKEVQRSLYVNMRETKRDPFFANSAAMVAAGLAAVWAALAQVPVMSGPLFSRERLLLIGAATGAYILKDRIKDLVKTVLIKKFNPWDHDYSMTGDALAAVGLGAFNGRVRERMRWIHEADLPESVKTLRRAQRTVRGSTIELEQVIHYRRELTFTPTKAEPLPAGYGLREILRLTLDDIIRRLDETTDTIHYYDENNSLFQQATIPRVYHLNIVLVSTDLSNGKRYKTRTRVVLNQKQILRVEHVLAETDMIEEE